MLASPGVTLLRWAQAPSPLAQGQHRAPAGSTQQTHDAGAPSQRTQSGEQVAVPPLLQPRFDPRVLRVCHHPGHRSRMTFRCPLFSGVNGLARHSCLKRSAPAVPAPTDSPGVPCLQPWGGHGTPPVPLQTPAPFAGPDLAALSRGRGRGSPNPSQLPAHIRAPATANTIPVRHRAALGGKHNSLPAAPGPPLHPFWGGGFRSRPGLTLEDEVIILLGAAHVAPAAARARRGRGRSVSSFPRQSLARAAGRRWRGAKFLPRRAASGVRGQQVGSGSASGVRVSERGSGAASGVRGATARPAGLAVRHGRLTHGVGLGAAAQVGQVVSPLGP